MNPIRNILVIVDPTAQLHPAVDKAALLAEKLDARLELYACDAKASRDVRIAAHARRHENQPFVVDLKSMLEQLAKPLREQGLDVATEVDCADPLHVALIDRARRTTADLIVKDTHHHSLAKRTFIALMWKDVNLKTKWLTVVGQTSKNNQTRRVPLNAEAATILEGWNRQSKGSLTGSYVFAGTKSKRMTAITTAWRSLRKLARLRNFNFHDLRHHFASRLVQSGVDLNSVRELLGHSDIKMVLRYAHLAPEGLASAVEKIARTETHEDANRRDETASVRSCAESLRAPA